MAVVPRKPTQLPAARRRWNRTLSTAAFGAGFVGIVVQVLIQAPQSALAMASSGNVEPGLALVMANMAYAFNVIAYVPLAVMLVAVALVRGVAWNRGIPEVVGVAIRGRRDGIPDHVGGHRSDTGPLAAGAWPTYVPYGLMAAWLLSTSSVIVWRMGKPTTKIAISGTPHELAEQTPGGPHAPGREVPGSALKRRGFASRGLFRAERSRHLQSLGTPPAADMEGMMRSSGDSHQWSRKRR